MRSWLESTKSPYDDCGYCQRQAQLRFGKGRMPRRFSFGSGIYGTYQLADSSAAQWEDIEVLEHLDDILAAFCSGPQDISQSRGLPGQANHARIKEFEAEVAGRVHAAGRKMTSDVIVAAGAARLFLDGARKFLRDAKGS